MKKTTKKSAPKASHKKTVKNLDLKPAKGGSVRGGKGTGGPILAGWDVKQNVKA